MVGYSLYKTLIAAVLLICCTVTTATIAHVELSLGKVTSRYTTLCDQYTYFKINIMEPCKDLRVLVHALAGEPNLYVSKCETEFPTIKSLVWSSYNWGTENLTIPSSDPNFSTGTYYIGVHAYCGTDVLTKYTPASYQVTVELVQPLVTGYLSLNRVHYGIVKAEKYVYYRFCIPNDCTDFDVKLQNCINTTTCPTTYTWPELLISNSVNQPKLKDRTWKLAEIARRHISLNHQQPNVRSGHYYVAVYGWCTPTQQCSDPATCGPCDNYKNGSSFTLEVTTKTTSDKCTNQPGCKPTNGAMTVSSSLSCIVCLMSIFAYRMQKFMSYA